MEWAYGEWGDELYSDGVLKEHSKTIVKWCEDNDISLSSKNKTKLLKLETWTKLKANYDTAEILTKAMGDAVSTDFNTFKTDVDKHVKAMGKKLGVSEKKAILNAVSSYDETAEKVIKRIVKLSSDKLDDLLEGLKCKISDLSDFGYFPTGNKGEYITYETNSDLRDSESVPMSETIHEYFQREVKPHVDEAWINLDSTKIGYEISFNKYFYKHKSLRNLDVVTKDILALEEQSEGLMAEILGVNPKQLSMSSK